MAATMKAIRVHEFGGPEVLKYEDAPRPLAGPGEMLLRVEATSVNPFDCAMRAGYLAGVMDLPLPYIPGSDIAGTIEEIHGGANGFKVGDAIFARGGVTRDGANAEFAVTSVTDVAHRPKSISLEEAAALPHVTLTAWQALFELGGLQKGQTVLIHGAGGGVGHIAVQLAKLRGATVIGTTSRDQEELRRLACDVVVDYTRESFERAAAGVDMVLDTVGGETQERSWTCLKPDGILVSVIQSPSPETATRYGVRSAMVWSAPPIGETLKQVAELVDSGKLRPIVSAVLPLRDIRKAHEMVETRHTHGKIVLAVT